MSDIYRPDPPRRDPDQETIPPDGRPYHEQPRWRRDFPIDWSQDDYVSRRDFTKFMVLISMSFTAGQFWILSLGMFGRRKDAPAEREIAAVDSLPVGKFLTFEYPDRYDSCVLIRLAEDRFVAYGQKCTHLSCAVVPKPETGQIHCPCHEGLFDLATGRPLAGPPRRPLPQVSLAIRGGKIYATGVKERIL
ncbi:MAG: ubiquinol-cytochrome c reductase iron-sulfur subunit [Armatimonadetes bacterium]|nr:ubiquinol-cytochrome c reductase iron-sulfur subunit [Armatimonadota bacterium]